LIENLSIVHSSLGQYLKQPLEIEEPARLNARRSIAAAEKIVKGETFTEENLIMLRPGSGIHPIFLDKIIGQRAKRDVRAGYLLSWEDVL
jgi:sialic acid synthase SpsE